MPREVELPPLATYKALSVWTPRYSDFVVWAGWFRIWFGLVNDFDVKNNKLSIIFEGTPRLLFTLTESEMKKNSYVFDLDDIRNNKRGRWYVQQHADGNTIWYI
jgi:hypothetical protein